MQHQWMKEVLQDMARYAAVHSLGNEYRELSRLAKLFGATEQFPAIESGNIVYLAKYKPESAR